MCEAQGQAQLAAQGGAGAGERGGVALLTQAAAKGLAALRARLEERKEEIEQAALARVGAIADPTEVIDSTYAESLRRAVGAAISYGIETTGREAIDRPIPVELLAQARLAARVGVPLETVQRRYFAGYSLLGYFILEEASHLGLADAVELKRVLGAHAAIFDRLLEAIDAEHARERASRLDSIEERRLDRVVRLLAGESIDTGGFGYDFSAHHLGVLATGAAAGDAVRRLADRLDCRTLAVRRDESTVWAWLGSSRRVRPPDEEPCGLDDVTLALGEPGAGLPGWRLTHRQAAAALPVGEDRRLRFVRYADVAVLASARRDELLVASLKALFIEPLSGHRDEGKAARATLRAYFASGRNLSAAASSLNVSRQAVGARLRAVEERTGISLDDSALELDLALRLFAEGD